MEKLRNGSDGVQSPHPNRTSEYFEWLRTDVIALVPESARTVLSVGCGAGITEAALVKSGRSVVGIEVDSDAAAKARSRGVEIIQVDATNAASLLTGKAFDCIIYSDVLEHLQSPEKVLSDHISLLTSDGSVIISIPNFRHWRVSWVLLVRGEFPYSGSGIFDYTHLRITTRKAAMRWVSDLNLQTTQVKYMISGRRYRLFSKLTLGILREFLASQVLIVAKRSPIA